MCRISSIIILDLLKNKAIIGYFILMVVLGWGIFAIESQPEKAILAILQVVLLVLPLITLVFATIYYYNSQEFILLLLAQPLRRSTLMYGLFSGLLIAFTLAFTLGIGIPVILFSPGMDGFSLLLSGIMLNVVFTSLALLVCVMVSDKARGMGLALLIWAFFAFIYDGLILLFMYQLADYPIESTVLALTFFNPIDIARIFVIMQTEASAMLGLSGAVFTQFFGSMKGMIISILLLLGWSVIFFGVAKKLFLTKDM